MARNFEFSKQTKDDAFNRQSGRCAICGQDLDRTGNPYQAHHIVSALYDGDDSLNNCAILCMERTDGGDGCHIYAHGDSYNRSFQLNRSEYRYFHG